MHYFPNSFSSNGQPTIEKLNISAPGVMGQRNGMSLIDIQQIKELYRYEGKRKCDYQFRESQSLFPSVINPFQVNVPILTLVF